MTHFDEYSIAFRSIAMRREDGISEMRLHTMGGPLHWNLLALRELEQAFLAVGRDRENGAVILTGTGDAFSGPQLFEGGHAHVKDPVTPLAWDDIYWEGKRLIGNLLDIDVPVLSAINGPALRHAEIPLLSDIDTATFQDSAHFNGGLVPGDGVHVLFQLPMGPTDGVTSC